MLTEIVIAMAVWEEMKEDEREGVLGREERVLVLKEVIEGGGEVTNSLVHEKLSKGSTGMQKPQISRAIHDLEKMGVIEVKRKVKEKRGTEATLVLKRDLDAKLMQMFITEGRKLAEKAEIAMYPASQVVSLGNATIYGIKRERFDFDVDMAITRELVKRVKQRKVSLNLKHYTEFLVDALTKVKLDMRREELRKTYEEKRPTGLLLTYKEFFIAFLNHTDIEAGWIKRMLFDDCRRKSALCFESEWDGKQFSPEFIEAIISTTKGEEGEITDFLIEVVRENIEWYPTRVMAVVRSYPYLKEPRKKGGRGKEE